MPWVPPAWGPCAVPRPVVRRTCPRPAAPQDHPGPAEGDHARSRGGEESTAPLPRPPPPPPAPRTRAPQSRRRAGFLGAREGTRAGGVPGVAHFRRLPYTPPRRPPGILEAEGDHST